jgi:hypothetical protein
MNSHKTAMPYGIALQGSAHRVWVVPAAAGFVSAGWGTPTDRLCNEHSQHHSLHHQHARNGLMKSLVSSHTWTYWRGTHGDTWTEKGG